MRFVRFTTAVVVALALGTVPLAADWCAAACEAAHAGASDAPPPCHHTGGSTAHIGQTPAPCGHDHHLALVDAATATAIASRATFAMTAPTTGLSVSVPSFVVPIARGVRDITSSLPLYLKLSSTLRV